MRSSSSTINGPSKLYVGDLGDNRKSDIARLFQKYGQISTIYFDEHKHFAFVEFTSSDDAQRALEHTKNKTVNGSKIRVEFAKSDKPFRRPPSRERSPTAAVYNHLQFTANRLPSMQTYRQSYYQQPTIPALAPPSSSRGRSLTPPSLKRHPPMTNSRPVDFYYPQQQPSAVHHEPNYYRNYPDPYLVQRLPPQAFVSSSRHPRTSYPRSRSRQRSRQKTSPSRRPRSSREKKRKHRSQSSSSSSSSNNQPVQRERGPRTPPPSKESTKKRSRSGSTSEQKSSSSSDGDEKQINSQRRSIEADSNRKHSKRKTRE